MADAAKAYDESAEVLSFLEGLLGLPDSTAAAAAPEDRAYPRTPLGDVVVTRPLDAWNGTAAFRKMAPHVFVIRLNVTSQDRDTVRDGLRALGDRIQEFLRAFDRRQYDPLDAEDHRGFATTAFIGFGRPFFYDRRTGERRFQVSERAVPRQLEILELAARDVPEPDADQEQSDLYISLEAVNRSLAAEGVRTIAAHLDQYGWLRIVDVVEGARREDDRSQLGFPSGLDNPSIETTPTADELALCTEADEPPALSQGTYLVHRVYRVDLDRWQALSRTDQEQLVGRARDDGSRLVPLPATSLAARVQGAGAPQIVRRGADALRIRSDGTVSRGLLYQFFQRSPEKQFERLHNQFLFGEGDTPPAAIVGSGIVKPAASGCYFAPYGLFASYPGHQFFHPELFERLFAALGQFAEAHYDAALALLREAEAIDPASVWSYAVQVECLQEVGRLGEARETLERMVQVAPTHHLYFEQLGWQLYQEREYARSAEASLRAIASYHDDSFRSYPYHDLGAALLELGQAADAEQAFRRSVARANLIAKHCFGLGNALDAQGRADEARKIYDRTVEVAQYLLNRNLVSPRDARTVLELIFIHYRSEAAQQTIDRIRDLVRIVPRM
jgi:Dyp-type peroxidase family